MRNYTALDMMRIVRISKEKKYKHLSRFKLLQAYKKEFPELSEEEKMFNLRMVLELNMSRRLNPKNHNHYITMCRRYGILQWGDDFNDPEETVNRLITKDTSLEYFTGGVCYRDAASIMIWGIVKDERYDKT